MRLLRSYPIALVAAVAVALSAAACGSSAPYAARVDGRSITQDVLENELRSIASNEAYVVTLEGQISVRGSGQGTFDAAFTAEVLTRQVLYALVRAEVESRDLNVTDVERDFVRSTVVAQAGGDEVFGAFSPDYQNVLVTRAAEINLFTLSLVGQVSAEEAARTYYDSHSPEFVSACVSHILVDSREKADALAVRLAAGEDFAALAQAGSQDIGTAAQGGDLGCDITPDTPLVPEFLAAVFDQPVGVTGAPVQSSFGFHLIKVTSRDVPPYESVKPQALDKVVATGQPRLREWLETAVDRADISVDPKYGTFRKAGVSSAVVPPQAPTTRAPDPAAGAPSLPVPG